MKGQLKINQLFAFVVVDEDGTEGVPATLDGRGIWAPLMGADMTFTIVRFGHREVIGTIDRSGEKR